MSITEMRPRAMATWLGHIAFGPPEACWAWTGVINHNGYGRFTYCRADGKSRAARAHRLAYEFVHGPIADGLQIDHLCRNRICVNPAHLQAVTIAVNSARTSKADNPCIETRTNSDGSIAYRARWWDYSTGRKVHRVRTFCDRAEAEAFVSAIQQAKRAV